jgi:nucleotide-binding universal stress UspA family protein
MSTGQTSQPPILVGYDPQSGDRASVQFGVAAARFTGAPLIVASVVAPEAVSDHDEELAPDAARALEDVRADLDLPVEVREIRGTSAPRALHELAGAEGAGMLVVGSTGQGPVGRVLPGSTAERLMHGAPCPIVVVPRGWERRGRLDPIGVAYTATEEGVEALRAGLVLARKAEATLRVLTAVKPSGKMAASTETYQAGQAGTDVQDVAGAHQVQAERGARNALAELGGGDVTTEVETFVDDPADVLIRVSENLDLLVCGSRGYGPVPAVLLGGVSRRVVASASCPVLVLARGVEAPLDAWAAAPGTIVPR